MQTNGAASGGLILRASDSSAAERWTLDLDVATLAGMAEPRNIRRTIAELAKEGILNDYDCGRMRPPLDGPAFKATVITVPRGNQGGTQEATEYRLNDDAVLRVLNRLRTPEAENAAAGFVATMRARLPALLAEAQQDAVLLFADKLRALSREEIAALVSPPPAPAPLPPAVEVPLLGDPRPVYGVNDDHRPIVAALVATLRAGSGFFFDRGRLYRHIEGERGEHSRPAMAIDMIMRLSEIARWERTSIAGRKYPVEPPTRFVRIIMACASEWAPPAPPDMFARHLEAYLSTWRRGSRLPLIDIAREVYKMRSPTAPMLSRTIADLTARGWVPLPGSRATSTQEFYQPPEEASHG